MFAEHLVKNLYAKETSAVASTPSLTQASGELKDQKVLGISHLSQEVVVDGIKLILRINQPVCALRMGEACEATEVVVLIHCSRHHQTGLF